MWIYDKKTQMPIHIRNKNPKLASYILSQYGGPDGELSASVRYLSQRFSMPNEMAKAVLNDIGTEELAHLEMVGTLVHQLTFGANAQDFDRHGVGAYYIDHAEGVYPANASGVPYTAAYIAVKADPIADLVEDLAAEQKARATYDNILRMSDDPDVNAVIKFLRAREVVHFQRFGEVLTHMQDQMRPRQISMST
jgi:spore coat protein JC